MLLTVKRPSRFSKGLAFSVSLPNDLAKNINLTMILFHLNFSYMRFVYTSPS